MSNPHFKGKVATLAFGGDGIIREEGLVIFCPLTIPNETVEGEIVEKKKSFALGKALRISDPSPNRITPRCPYFGVCGGCQLQHMNIEAQLEVKRQWVIEALQRIGGINDVHVDPVHPSQPWTYRRHITLTLFPFENNYYAGYSAVSKGQSIEVEVCPIFIEENNPVIRQIQQVAHQLNAPDRNLGKVSILKQEDGKFFFEFNFKTLPSNAEEVLKQASDSCPAWSGIVCKSPGKTFKWGEAPAQLKWGRFEIAYSIGAFIQNNPEQSSAIYAEVDHLVKTFKPEKGLDLYSGVGISTLILSQYCKTTTGIDLSADAIKLAKKNVKANGDSSVKMIEGDVEQKLLSLSKPGAYDFVLLNPPREGAGIKVMETIAQIGPRHVVYISCMPPTLARDLKSLCANGYKILSCKPYDMFPQTAHVETVVCLERT